MVCSVSRASSTSDGVPAFSMARSSTLARSWVTNEKEQASVQYHNLQCYNKDSFYKAKKMKESAEITCSCIWLLMYSRGSMYGGK